jgi:hypothetical protein
MELRLCMRHTAVRLMAGDALDGIQPGQSVEVFSKTLGSWQAGHVVSVEGQMVHVQYAGGACPAPLHSDCACLGLHIAMAAVAGGGGGGKHVLRNSANSTNTTLSLLKAFPCTQCGGVCVCTCVCVRACYRAGAHHRPDLGEPCVLLSVAGGRAGWRCHHGVPRDEAGCGAAGP